ncbi:hypothetical protein NL676_003577 [Syzygium grande]|nr:hypothetical protein NL676_003577 [Syzygium grande]
MVGGERWWRGAVNSDVVCLAAVAEEGLGVGPRDDAVAVAAHEVEGYAAAAATMAVRDLWRFRFQSSASGFSCLPN